jgi:hypothetical protein
MTAAHSTWSASGFEQKMLCPGSHVLQAGLPNTSSKYAAEGTAAHLVLTYALQESRPASAYVGRLLKVEGFEFEVDEDMAGYVQTCIDYVQDAAGEGMILVDQRVNYASYLDVPESTAWGTADVIIIRDEELIVVDFKYGRGVDVRAEENPQLMLYALGTVAQYGLAADFSRVRVVISQPRIKAAPVEWDLTVEELETWGRTVGRSAVLKCQAAEGLHGAEAWESTFLSPGEKQCNFCRAKATCPALRNEVAETALEFVPATPSEFTSITIDEVLTPYAHDPADWLSTCLTKVDLIEGWCKSIRAEAERRLRVGDQVPGFKLVQGKRGNRAWSNVADAEAYLRKSVRLPVEKAYDMKLISPATAEKLAKAGDIGERQWAKVQELITQKDGVPHVAPESDSRPALEIKPVAEDFDLIA